jgi:stearoyl-CoA desaturase (delta-9 desaturase)
MFVITLVTLQVSIFCTTVFLHRCKTHRGLELNPVVGALMHLELSLFTGVIPRQWAAVHRKHHHFSDEPGDPHSPYIYGLWTVLFGNYYFYRKEANDRAMVRKYTPDWKDDALDEIPFMNYAALVGMAIFMLMFGVWWGLAAWTVHIAFLTAGEGLHNNHHQYPTSARFSLRRHEIDPAWPIIRLLEACKLAKVRQLPMAKAAA